MTIPHEKAFAQLQVFHSLSKLSTSYKYKFDRGDLKISLRLKAKTWQAIKKSAMEIVCIKNVVVSYAFPLCFLLLSRDSPLPPVFISMWFRRPDSTQVFADTSLSDFSINNLEGAAYLCGSSLGGFRRRDAKIYTTSFLQMDILKSLTMSDGI